MDHATQSGGIPIVTMIHDLSLRAFIYLCFARCWVGVAGRGRDAGGHACASRPRRRDGTTLTYPTTRRNAFATLPAAPLNALTPGYFFALLYCMSPPCL